MTITQNLYSRTKFRPARKLQIWIFLLLSHRASIEHIQGEVRIAASPWRSPRHQFEPNQHTMWHLVNKKQNDRSKCFFAWRLIGINWDMSWSTNVRLRLGNFWDGTALAICPSDGSAVATCLSDCFGMHWTFFIVPMTTVLKPVRHHSHTSWRWSWGVCQKHSKTTCCSSVKTVGI